ncbi:hypothetical protein CXG81DRAFT_28558 [Caulochytrium protostelioides]|uniref:Uncharacterized protein n=1 Tax=Caulochytrium protostelioides TaxID=1555241 RepID=A0A4V1ITY1_9FUNG|nr:hypothetical protein CXG81DRAFT_28558 [Caulochytrium protostelioides]|eukprot:RKO98637.1 hypothetical protein CXG81DRAFT_28558 [Caulochytrium protostelioides]
MGFGTGLGLPGDPAARAGDPAAAARARPAAMGDGCTSAAASAARAGRRAADAPCCYVVRRVGFDAVLQRAGLALLPEPDRWPAPVAAPAPSRPWATARAAEGTAAPPSPANAVVPRMDAAAAAWTPPPPLAPAAEAWAPSDLGALHHASAISMSDLLALARSAGPEAHTAAARHDQAARSDAGAAASSGLVEHMTTGTAPAARMKPGLAAAAAAAAAPWTTRSTPDVDPRAAGPVAGPWRRDRSPRRTQKPFPPPIQTYYPERDAAHLLLGRWTP